MVPPEFAMMVCAVTSAMKTVKMVKTATTETFVSSLWLSHPGSNIQTTSLAETVSWPVLLAPVDLPLTWQVNTVMLPTAYRMHRPRAFQLSVVSGLVAHGAIIAQVVASCVCVRTCLPHTKESQTKQRETIHWCSLQEGLGHTTVGRRYRIPEGVVVSKVQPVIELVCRKIKSS